MNKTTYNSYLAILTHDLVVAMGCTEPIAIAYAGAKARQILGKMPEHCTVFCSGNIVKNAKSVTVPNSGGLKGIGAAAILGIVGGDPARKLAVLETATPEDVTKTKTLLAKTFCQCELLKDIAGLYIKITVSAGQDNAEVVIENYHSNIIRITKNGKDVFSKQNELSQTSECEPEKELLNIKDILIFANRVNMEDVDELISRQICK